MELLHYVVKRQKLTAVDFRVLQSVQPLQHVQAHLGDKCSWGQIHLDQGRSSTPSKSTMEASQVVQKTKKNTSNEAKYKV